MKPGIMNYEVVRGTTPVFRWRLSSRTSVGDSDDSIIPLVLDDIRLSVGKDGANIFRASLRTDLDNPGGIVNTDPLTGDYRFVASAAQTRALPKNKPVPYELEIRTGTSQLVYLTGTMTGTGGSNDD